MGLGFWGWNFFWNFGSMPCRCLEVSRPKNPKNSLPRGLRRPLIPALFPGIILLFQACNVGFPWNVELSGTGATCAPGSFHPKKSQGTGPGGASSIPGGSTIPRKYQNSLEALEFPGVQSIPGDRMG